MSVTNSAVYTKDGAVFATAQEAWDDKNSLYGPGLQQAVDDCFAQMLLDGVLLEPVYPTWDQATYTLTIVKHVSSIEAYNAAVTFNVQAVVADAAAAGWTFIRVTTI